MRSLLVIIVLMLTAPVFALEPALDLQDSLAADSLRVDSLSKISLTAGIDTNDVVDTNKVERIDPTVEATDYSAKNFFPDGFFVEIAYAAPTALHLSLLGGRDNWNNGKPLEKYSFFI